MVVVYGEDKRILASYPATIGSENTPSPEGEHKVTRIAREPDLSLRSREELPAGQEHRAADAAARAQQSGGHGLDRISKPTYGIHGTPEPSKVSKTSSHGCVRLTNWDAEELADMIKPGVVVRFVD